MVYWTYRKGRLHIHTYQTVVFRAAKGGGNPCPVTQDADALTTEQMQEMTKNFGFESVFLMQPDREDCDIKARYFVPLHEMEMCVHATIGSATVLVEKGRFVESPIYYQTAFGKIQVDWERDENGLHVSAHQFLPRFAKRGIAHHAGAAGAAPDLLGGNVPHETDRAAEGPPDARRSQTGF